MGDPEYIGCKNWQEVVTHRLAILKMNRHKEYRLAMLRLDVWIICTDRFLPIPNDRDLTLFLEKTNDITLVGLANPRPFIVIH